MEIKPEAIKEIAEMLDAGMLCFYHKATGKVEYYPTDLEFSDLEDMWADVTGKIEANPDDYVQFEPMPSYAAYTVMENFIDEIPIITTRREFISAINRKKPFRQFSDLLLNYPDLREQWFAYKHKRYMAYVKEQSEHDDYEAEEF